MADDSLKPIDTIRLSPRDKQRLVDEIQRPSRVQSPESERRRLRVDYNGHVVIVLRNPDGGTVRYSVTPRNLSSHGIGFIHGQYVHANRPCDVIIPTLKGEWLLSKARISRCKHLAKLIHDVSMVFDQPITLDDYVALSPEQALAYHQQSSPAGSANAPAPAAAEKEPEKLSGNVVVADDASTDRQMYGMWLGKLGVKTFPAGNQQEIHDAMDKQDIDLLMIDLKLGGMSGLEIIEQLRLADFKAPIIVTCESETDQVQAQALAAGANAIITKPLDRDTLNQIVEQLLLVSDGDAAANQDTSQIRSQMIDDPDMVPFIHSFVTELNSLTEMLTKARASKDEGKLTTVCTRIKCGGSSYGFAPLTRMAKLALGQLQHNPSVSASEKALDDLVAMLARIRA